MGEQETRQETNEQKGAIPLQLQPISHLETSILAAVQKIGTRSYAFEQLKAGNIDAVLDTAETEEERATRRDFVTPANTSLQGRLEHITRLGNLARTMRDEDIPSAYTELGILVGEWQRRWIEKEEVAQTVTEIEREFIESGLLSRAAYITPFEEGMADYYPSGALGTLFETIFTPSPKQARETEQKRTVTQILPIAPSRLTALGIFVTQAKFDTAGNLAITQDELRALAGRTKKDRKDRTIPGTLALAMETVRQKGGKDVPMNTRNTHLALRGALTALENKLLTHQQLLPDEAEAVGRLQEFTGLRESNQALDAIKEAKRRLEIVFEAVKFPNTSPTPNNEGQNIAKSVYDQALDDFAAQMIDGELLELTLRNEKELADVIAAFRQRIASRGKQLVVESEGNTARMRAEDIASE